MNQFFLEINKVEKAPNYPLHDLRLFVIEEKYCKPQISLLMGLNKLQYYLNLTKQGLRRTRKLRKCTN